LSDAFQASLEYAFAINLHKFIIITIIVLIEHDPVRHRSAEGCARARGGSQLLNSTRM
jgi:hypothetical protein